MPTEKLEWWIQIWRSTNWAFIREKLEILGLVEDIRKFENGEMNTDEDVKKVMAMIDLLTQFVTLHIDAHELRFTPHSIASGGSTQGWFQEAAEEFLIAAVPPMTSEVQPIEN